MLEHLVQLLVSGGVRASVWVEGYTRPVDATVTYADGVGLSVWYSSGGVTRREMWPWHAVQRVRLGGPES